MKELFPVNSVKMLSPRLKWMKKHRLSTEENGRRKPEERWMAWSASYLTVPRGFGETEEEAIRDWGVRAKQKLWNELP